MAKLLAVNLEQLTVTEARLAGLIASGHNDREISAQLALDDSARERHLSEIYRKLGIRSRTELALLLGQARGRRTNRAEQPIGASDRHTHVRRGTKR